MGPQHFHALGLLEVSVSLRRSEFAKKAPAHFAFTARSEVN
jgi:hypothetical protein